jgi:hypothetical protein
LDHVDQVRASRKTDTPRRYRGDLGDRGAPLARRRSLVQSLTIGPPSAPTVTGRRLAVRIVVARKFADALTQENIADLTTFRMALYYYGRIRYFDAFGVERNIYYRYRYSYGDDGIAPCEEDNRMDQAEHWELHSA